MNGIKILKSMETQMDHTTGSMEHVGEETSQKAPKLQEDQQLVLPEVNNRSFLAESGRRNTG